MGGHERYLLLMGVTGRVGSWRKGGRRRLLER